MVQVRNVLVASIKLTVFFKLVKLVIYVSKLVISFFNEIFQIENSSDSSYLENSSEEGIELCHCDNKEFCSCKKTINVLTKSEQIIFELIDKIEDPQIKFEYLKKISQIDHQDTPLAKIDNTKYNYTNISDMFKKQKA